MIDTPEQTLAYERWMIGTAIRSITELMDKQPKQGANREFYEVMLLTCMAIEQCMERIDGEQERIAQVGRPHTAVGADGSNNVGQ